MKKYILLSAVLVSLVLSTACTIDVGGDRVNFDGNISVDKGSTLKEEKNIGRNAADIEKLELKNTAGNISIKTTSSEDISIKVIKNVKSTDENVKAKILQNMDVAVIADRKKLSVYPVTADGKKNDLWKWVEQQYKGAQVSIDFEVEVPEHIKFYTIKGNAGNINMESVTGQVTIEQNAGNVDLKDVKLNGTSDINVNAGMVTIDADIGKADKLAVSNTAGQIRMILPADSGFDLEAKITAGNIGGSFLSGSKLNSGTLKQQINGGGTKVIVTTVAGNVTIDSK